MCVYFIVAGGEQTTQAQRESRVIGPTQRPAPAYYNSGMYFYTRKKKVTATK